MRRPNPSTDRLAPSRRRPLRAFGVTLGGCVLGAGAVGSGQLAAAPAGSADATLDVVASFYPLEFVVSRVGGDVVSASNLTPAGAEPHDMELTPQAMASLQDADLVVYLDGFAPAIDEGVAQLPADQVLDVTAAARLDLVGGEDEHDDDHTDSTATDDDHTDDTATDDDHTDDTATDDDHTDDNAEGGSVDDHTDEDAHDEDDHDHDHEGADPHFWLDPTRLADVADEVAAHLGVAAPESADVFTANAAALRAELEALDAEFETGLASCESSELVTSHTAFAYLADRYGFTQVGITGVTPHEEPSPAELAELTHFVEDHGVATIYTETLVDPAIAETVAAETGASTAVLDPLEGLTDESAGTDYLEVMRANLEALRDGQGCS
ncbi:MAG: metal ABC transporter substrate-binding protein [Desertimonas sp.]